MVNTLAKKYALIDDYTYTTETYDFYKGSVPYIHTKALSEQLEDTILHNQGGALLVAGTRGVGKTTLVNHVINKISRETNEQIFKIQINFSSTKEYLTILYEMARGFHDVLKESDLWNKLSSETTSSIELINKRTMMTGMKFSSGNADEIEKALELGSDKLPFSGNIKEGSKTSRTQESTLRDMSIYDTEAGLKEIIHKVRQEFSDIRFVIVIDEVDKLTQDTEGKAWFEDFLSSAKGLIGNLDAFFVIVTGLDIYWKWREVRKKINNIYKSIFKWQLYIPCIWDSVEDYFSVFKKKDDVFDYYPEHYTKLTEKRVSKGIVEPFDMLNRYLIFKGQGIAGDIFNVFNKHVRWLQKHPYFVMSEGLIQEMKNVDALYFKFQSACKEMIFESIADRDVFYMIFLSVLDYMFEMKKDVFTRDDIINALLTQKDVEAFIWQTTIDKVLRAFVKAKMVQEKKDKSQKHFYTITDMSVLELKNGEEHLSYNHDDNELEEDDFDKLEFRNRVSGTGIDEIKNFYNDYQFIKYYARTLQYAVCGLKVKTDSSYEIATFYNDLDQKYIGIDWNDTIRFCSPMLTKTIYQINNGKLFASIQVPVEGLLLSEMVSAGIKKEYIYLIICQLIDFVSYLMKKDYSQIVISPENLMICNDGRLKILDLLSFIDYYPLSYSLSENENKEVLLNELVLGEIGRILLLMLSNGDTNILDPDMYGEIDFFIQTIECSKKLKKIIGIMMSEDKNSLLDPKELKKQLSHCPEFKHAINKRIVSLCSSEVVIRSYAPQMYHGSVATNPMTIMSSNGELLPYDAGTTALIGMVDMFDKNITGVLSYVPESSGNKRLMQHSVAYLINRETNERVEIDKAYFTIGRSGAEVDYSVSDSAVSKKHAAILFKNDKFYIEDFRSSNGLFVNGKRVGIAPEILKDGSIITIGRRKLLFIIVMGDMNPSNDYSYALARKLEELEKKGDSKEKNLSN